MADLSLSIDHGAAASRAVINQAERRRHAVLAWIIWLAVAANGAVIVWLWLVDGGVSGVHTPAAGLTTIGRLTGLLASYFLLIQVLLIARLPFIERPIGFDRLTVWHRRNGKLCLYLVLAHVVFITVGYAMTDRLSLGAEAATLLKDYPGMGTATIGTVLMIVVVVSSLVIVRHRLRYETWYLVHLSAYLSIYLSWGHQIPTGLDLTANLAAQSYWVALYLVTFGLLVLFRILRPILWSFWFRLQVKEVIEEGPGVVSIHIAGRHLEQLGAQAGQFFLWRFLGRGRWWEAHPFSLSAVPGGAALRITVKASGDFSRDIGAIKPGTRILAEGPFGAFTTAQRRHDRVVLIAGGIGITPIRALVEEMDGNLILIYRVMRDDDLVFRAELEHLAAGRDLRLSYVVGDHRDPGAGYLLSAEHLRELVPDIVDRDVYLCGPPAMMDVIESNVRRANVPASHIHTERFAL